MVIDLRTASFDEWIGFIFNHPPAMESNGDTEQEWYWDPELEVLVDPTRQIVFITDICTSASRLLNRFSAPEIDQGLWYMFSAGGEDEFWRHLWNPGVAWELRERCIAAIPCLWPELFERADVGSMAFMLWDSIAYDYYCGNRHPGDDSEDHRVQDAMFRALLRQLSSSVPATQQSALHGLGHLRHPDTQSQVLQFLTQSDLDADTRAYADNILAGKFQ
jgi:hypothetical protein